MNRIFQGVAAVSAATLLLSSFPVVAHAETPEENPEIRKSTPHKVPEQATDRFVVGFKESVKSNADARAKAYGKSARFSGITVKEIKATQNGARVVKASKKLTAAESEKVMKDLKSDPNVTYVEPDVLMQAASYTDDPYFGYQWNLTEKAVGLNLPAVWDTTTGAGQTVAVLDTGITGHSDLNENILPGYDMISDGQIARDGNGRDANPQDEGDWLESGQCGAEATPSSWHGTHVAGSIAALRNNGNGVSGAAPSAKVVPVRVLGACGGYMSDIADGIIWASGGTVAGVPANPNPAKIINLSLGGNAVCSVTTQNAINTAVSNGSALFVAAGNSAIPVSNSTPANCNNVIAVAASGPDGSRASYSNYGEGIDITAPGGDFKTAWEEGILAPVNIGSTVPEDEAYAFMVGTSMATPMAASVGALLLSHEPTLTPAQMETRLKETSRPLPVPCSEGCGSGLITPTTALGLNSGEETPSEFVTSSQPLIMGTFNVGSTLMVHEGEWGPAPVEFSYQWYNAGVEIAGATSSSYTLKPADKGAYIYVEVTGSKDGYVPTTETSNGAVVEEGALLSSVPTISGEAKVGGTLYAQSGEWGPDPVTLSYQWYRNGAVIAGATNDMYLPSTGDAQTTLTVAVTGTKEGYGATTKVSRGVVVAAGSFSGSTPVISGGDTVGSVLTAEAPDWGPYPLTLSYQWNRDGAAITGATAYQYTATGDDAGKTITVTVTAKRAGYTDYTKVSAGKTIASAVITGTKPVIVGEARVGNSLTVGSSTWGPAPVALSYQWFRDGVAIAGATTPSRVATADDAGKVLSVAVTGTKSGYPSKTLTSDGTAAVLTGNLLAGTPTISGSTTVGSTLTAATGTWGPGPVAYAYQWYRSGVAITGATSATLVLTGDDAGKAITVKVTGSKAGYTPVEKTSAGTAAVANGTLSAPVPTITGTVKVGYRLTANPGTWGPAPVTLAYQWKRAGVNIVGATASTYVATSADLGKSLTVTVTGSKAGYTTVAKNSAGTAAVAAGTLTAPVPTITGTVKVGYALTANPGAWTSGTTLRYQWYRSGVAISGATASKYVLNGSDYNKLISVRVTGSKAGYTTVTKASANTRAVVAGTLVAGTPTISGTARSGYTLTAKPGTWTAGTTLRYQWYRSGVAISGATAATYRLVTADRYDTIKVRVVGSKAGYTSVTKFSASTVRIP